MRVELYDSRHMAIVTNTLEEERIIKKIFPQGEEGYTRFGREKAIIVKFDNWLVCKNIIDIYR